MTAEEIVRDSVGAKELADYLSAPWGCTLGVYADGTVSVGESVGSEIAEEDRPVATAKCPGIGNIDMTWWRADWECERLTDEEVIAESCENGDVSDELDDLIEKLIADAEETARASKDAEEAAQAAEEYAREE